ncbi:hypothetical protein ACFLZ9_00715 [Patescibacteria group bacterium]
MLWIVWFLITCIILNFKNNEKLLAEIYFTTAVIIFWYTRETHDLKENQRKELHEIRKQTDFEMRPYLRMQWSEDPKRKEIVLHIVNCGRGLAVNVEFEKFDLTVNLQKIRFHILKRPLISSGGLTSVDIGELQNNIQILEGGLLRDNIKRFIYTAITDFENELIVKVKYKDIVNNKYIAEFKFDSNYNDKFTIIEQKKINY